MTVLSEIADAMNRYPQDETTIEIVNVAKVGDPGDTDVNEREVWEFHVKTHEQRPRRHDQRLPAHPGLERGKGPRDTR